jgi:hypothetical protein
LGEEAYNETWVEVKDLENLLMLVDLELGDLEREEVISVQVTKMKKNGGMSFWPTPILHPNRPPCDGPNMIIIKGCGLCGQWYHCFDVVVTFCLHTYHLACLRDHKTHNKCKVCNQRFHPN